MGVMGPLPDYLGHDAEYRRRRALGRKGWDEEASFRQTIAAMEAFWEAPVPLVASGQPTMIELGCGAGDLSLYFASHGFQVTGIDIAPFAIEWAREKAAKRGMTAAFLVADLTRELDFPPPPADLVLDGHCLHCIIGDDRQVFLRNARRCLGPGGIFHVNSMCGTPHAPNGRNFDPISRCIVQSDIAQRYFGMADSILQELADAGFKILRHAVIPAQYEGDEDCLLADVTLEPTARR